MQELGSIQNVSQGAYVNNATPRKAVQGKGCGDRQPRENVAATIARAAASEEATPSVGAILAPTAEAAENASSGPVADEAKSTLREQFREWIDEVGSAVERRRKTATSSNGGSTETLVNTDRNFGVEQLSYKNMWKVLKTVVKEIDDIKKANSGRFFLGVNERLEKATTLMEFGSIADYLEERSTFRQKTVPPEATDGEAGRIVADPAASVQAQANVVPEVALHLLAGTE